MQSIKALVKKQNGQTMAEYGVILFVIALVAFAAFALLGGNVRDLVDDIASALS